MKKVLYYYAYLEGNYRYIVQDQLSKILLSGLYSDCDEVQLRVASPEPGRVQWLLNIVKDYPKFKAKVIELDRSIYPPEFHEMKIALQHLAQQAREEEGYYGWVHAKGVTNGGYHTDQWRMSMDHATIWEYKKSWDMLNIGYGAVGPNLRHDTFLGVYPHYSGCYFWASSKHIKTLKEEYLTDLHNKYSGEFWIGSNNHEGMGSTFECGHEAPYAIESTINQYIKI